MSSDNSEKNFFGRVKDMWMKFIHALGNAVAKLQLGLVYFTILVPFGIFTRIWRDPLDFRPRAASTYWHPHVSEPPKLIEGRE